MNHELNKAIENLILNKPKSQSYSTRELNYIRRYDKCEDEGLDIEETIRQIWDTRTIGTKCIVIARRSEFDYLQ